MGYDTRAVRRAFGTFFIGLAIGIAVAASLGEIAYRSSAPIYIYPIIWIGVLAGTILALKLKHRNMFRVMGWRFRQSKGWPVNLKAVTAICWAAPFLAISVFPEYYSYLILLGIGLGNTSTYLTTRKATGVNFSEQLVVGMVSLVALPLLLFLDSSHIFSSDMLQFFTRLFIAAYGAGGAYAFADVI